MNMGESPDQAICHVCGTLADVYCCPSSYRQKDGTLMHESPWCEACYRRHHAMMTRANLLRPTNPGLSRVQ